MLTQTFEVAQVAGPLEAPTTYMAIGAVLIVLVFLTLWREMTTTNTIHFFPRSFAALAFISSRVLVVIFTAALVDRHSTPPLLYILLNFVCLYLAVTTLPYAIRPLDQPETPGVSRDERGAAGAHKALHFQMAIFGLVGAVVYMGLPRGAGSGAAVATFINMVFLAATVRVVIELLYLARTSRSEIRHVLSAMVVSATLSWLFVIGASAFTGSVSLRMLQAARAADIFALVMGLFAQQTSYVVQGFRHKSLAVHKHEEAEKAKAEVKLLNRVASDLYEDSSDMIQRQQDRFRDMIARVDSLEKILQIGIKIQQNKDLKELLQMVARLIREELGFKTVILRLLNERTQSFETKAYVGLNADAEEAVMHHRLPLSEFTAMLEPRFQISRSYFLKNLTTAAESTNNEPRGLDARVEDTIVVIDHWSEIDRLIIPLYDDEAEVNTVGYISVEEPESSELSMVDAIDNLETIATLAVIAIRNTSYYKEVGEKNEKLRLYAEKLSSLNRMKSNFVATVSHEFRTPLTSIKAYCETLLKNADNVDRNILKEFLIVIDEESDRLMTLVEDILDFSKMESGAIKFERTVCDLNNTITAAAGEMEKHFSRKNITLKCNTASQPVLVRSDCELMKQMLVNMMHNAAKFTQEGGNVSVTLEDEIVSARLVVEDDGIGIPEDQIERIFDHFHQADNGSTRKYGGTGMGLAICKNIVDWHDGKIWVENAPGRGARFVVVIPKKQVVVRNRVMNLEGTMRRFEVERYLEVIVEMVAELMNAKKASLMLIDKETGELRIESAIGLDEEIVEHARVKPGEGIAGRVARDNKSLLVEDIDQDARVQVKNNDHMYDSHTFLSVPLSAEDEVLGVINVANPIGKSSFDTGDCRLLELFADRVTLALNKLSGFTGASSEFESVRTAFKSMLDARRYIGHLSATGMSVVLDDVAGRLGLSSDERATLRYVFNVYDLGLAHVGYNIIKQSKQLTQKDRESVEQHTIIGTDMLKPIELNPAVRDAVLYHHENYDGSGYPGKLTGEEIPQLARIIRVADTFRALISHRPYQKQYTIAEAVEVLKHRTGTFFDPSVVRVFVESVDSNKELFQAPEREQGDREKTTVDTLS